MGEEYKLFEVHYVINGRESSLNGVGYEVARDWEEARELFMPHLARIQMNSRDVLGDRSLECKLEDIRELDISHTGWKMRLEKKNP